MPEEKPKLDPLKDPRITAMTAIVLTLVCPLLLRAVCYLILTFSAMAVYVGVCGLRASFASNRFGYLFLSMIGTIGGLVFLAIGLIMGYSELCR
jgi:hypothetical protein